MKTLTNIFTKTTAIKAVVGNIFGFDFNKGKNVAWDRNSFRVFNLGGGSTV